jgi:hypothetical protein
MSEVLATPEVVRRRIMEAPAYETITLGDWKVRGFPTRAALGFGLLSGCRAKEVVSIVSPGEAREGIAYGVNGRNLTVEEYEGEEYLVANVTVLKKKLQLASTRTFARPRSPQYEPLAKVVEDAFIRVGDAPVFNYTRQTISEAARRTFTGLSYYIHPYLHFPDPIDGVKQKGEEIQGHPRPMAFHAVRHITEQELDETFHFEDKQTQQFFKWSNTYMGVPEAMGRYRSKQDWHTYASKFLRKS